MSQWDDNEGQDPNNAGTVGAAPGNDPYAQIRAMYQQITGGKYTPTDADVSQWGTNIDGNYYQKIQQAIGQWWQQQQAQAPKANPEPNPTVTPPPDGSGGSAGGSSNDIFNAPLTKMYGGTFTPPTPTNIGGPAGVGQTPTFNAPAYTPPPAFQFHAPSVEEALNEPGYKFRVDQSNRGIQNWAAAKGTLNDSSTAKALSDYAGGAASSEYANVWNRAWQSQLGGYEENYKTQYADPYAVQFGAANVQNQNNALGYSTNAAQVAHQNDTNYLNSWNQFLDSKNTFYNWQDRVFGKQFQTATA